MVLIHRLRRATCAVVARLAWRRAAKAGTLLALLACGTASTETGSEGLVIWTRPSPAGPAFASFPGLAASDSGLFLGYDNTAIAVSARDGRTLWQRSDVRARGLLTIGDSVVALPGGGTTIGLWQATGATLWSRQVPGERSNVPPILVAGGAIFNTSDGTLWSVEGLSGNVRQLASTTQLADTAGASVWALAASGDTAVVFLQIDSDVGETGDFVVSRVHVPSATVISRRRMTRLTGEFAENRRMVVQDSVVVVPINGCAIAVDSRTARRLWTQCLNIVEVQLRDGMMTATSGNGEMFGIDPLTGRITLRLDMGVSSPFDQFPCREGIVFVNSALQIVANQIGARPRAIAGSTPDDEYVGIVRHGNSLFAHGERYTTALRCN